jgi:hypothetical protein
MPVNRGAVDWRADCEVMGGGDGAMTRRNPENLAVSPSEDAALH